MNPQEYAKLQEISRLLNEAYDHYFEYEGHCKSAEAQIEVGYGNLWDRQDDPSNLKVQYVHIYSYVFCRDGRAKSWQSVDEALEEVRGWHAEEMAYDYNSPEALENQRLMNEMAAEFLESMIDSGRLEVHYVDFSEDDDEEGPHGVPF